MEGWVDLGDLLHTEMVYLSSGYDYNTIFIIYIIYYVLLSLCIVFFMLLSYFHYFVLIFYITITTAQMMDKMLAVFFVKLGHLLAWI